MNPYTRSLLERIQDPALEAFVGCWDTLEALVIAVYKGKQATAEQEAEYTDLRSWLADHYSIWEMKLAPYWRSARVAHQPAATDPFVILITPENALEFVGNWQAMQTLPAAREALNLFLLEISQDD